jgi:hypothetical protein
MPPHRPRPAPAPERSKSLAAVPAVKAREEKPRVEEKAAKKEPERREADKPTQGELAAPRVEKTRTQAAPPRKAEAPPVHFSQLPPPAMDKPLTDGGMLFSSAVKSKEPGTLARLGGWLRKKKDEE